MYFYRLLRLQMHFFFFFLYAGGTPTIRSLWLSEDPDIQRRRFYTCMACFHVEGWTEELRGLETHLAATCCLLIYLAVQVLNILLLITQVLIYA